MTHYDTEMPSLTPGLPERPNHLGRQLLLDLVIIVILTLIVVLAVQVGLVGVRAVQQGLDMSKLGELGPEGMLRLIGVEGIVATLLLQNGIFMLWPIIRTRFFRRESLRTIGFQADRPLRLIAFGIGLGILTLMGNAIIGLLFAQAGVRQNQSAQYPLFQGDYIGQFAFFIGAAILAPLGEEVLFRGYVFNTIRRMWGGGRNALIFAYLISALLFAIAHSLAATEGLIALLGAAFVMGILLAWGMHRTGSLIPCLIAHSMNNGVALLALLSCVNNPGLCPNV